MVKPSTKERWPGGYIHVQQDGRQLFIIEKRVNGRRFHVSTRCHSWTSAMKQLERFEANPLGYSPAGDEPEAPLQMTDELVEQYEKWQVGRGVTKKHANEMGNRLADWMEDLAGQDLRKVTLRDAIKPALDRRTTCRSHRIIALKGFYSWLRKERHLLTSGQDPTLDLPVPQATPEKWKRRKAVPVEHVRAALEKLAPAYRDMLLVLGGTGWHVTELERFVRSEESEIVDAQRGATLAVLVTRHKVGDLTRTPVLSQDVLEAARRLKERGSIPRRANAELKAACEAVKVPTFTFGVMRHSVGTWGVEAGALPAVVSEFLNHKDPRTTKRFYTDVAVPTAEVRLPALMLVKGG